jgi:hypothetical protein
MACWSFLLNVLLARQNADYEQKRETGDVTITWGLDLTGPHYRS